jgi:hypothetical protein
MKRYHTFPNLQVVGSLAGEINALEAFYLSFPLHLPLSHPW